MITYFKRLSKTKSTVEREHQERAPNVSFLKLKIVIRRFVNVCSEKTKARIIRVQISPAPEGGD